MTYTEKRIRFVPLPGDVVKFLLYLCTPVLNLGRMNRVAEERWRAKDHPRKPRTTRYDYGDGICGLETLTLRALVAGHSHIHHP